VKDSVYQMLDFALHPVRFTLRPLLYPRRPTSGKWCLKEKSSGSWLDKITTWTTNIETKSSSRWWRRTLIHSDESKFVCEVIWCHFTDLQEFDKQCGIWCLYSCGRAWFPNPFSANVNNKLYFPTLYQEYFVII